MKPSILRLRKELDMLARNPSPGISAWAVSDQNILNLEASIIGPEDSPYCGGTYSLSILVPDRYPFEPPRVRFLTPIYHPNIDSEGRICLDTLKSQPQGSWTPSININTLLLTIRLLMGEPNADDGLVPDITELYRRDIGQFRRIAQDHARKYAFGNNPKALDPADPITGSKTENGEVESIFSDRSNPDGVDESVPQDCNDLNLTSRIKSEHSPLSSNPEESKNIDFVVGHKRELFHDADERSPRKHAVKR